MFGNTQGYAVLGSTKGGSLITLITRHLSNYASNDSKNKVLSNKTFQQLLYPIQREIHNAQRGNQTMEIVNRALGYDQVLREILILEFLISIPDFSKVAKNSKILETILEILDATK